MTFPCLLNWISIKAFRVHSYSRAQYSTLTSEYQIESGVLRRAACEAVRTTLFITLSIFRLQTTITRLFQPLTYSQIHTTQIRDYLPARASRQLKIWGPLRPGRASLKWLGRTFSWWHFPHAQALQGCSPHSMSAHIMQSGAEWMCQLPIRPH